MNAAREAHRYKTESLSAPSPPHLAQYSIEQLTLHTNDGTSDSPLRRRTAEQLLSGYVDLCLELKGLLQVRMLWIVESIIAEGDVRHGTRFSFDRAKNSYHTYVCCRKRSCQALDVGVGDPAEGEGRGIARYPKLHSSSLCSGLAAGSTIDRLWFRLDISLGTLRPAFAPPPSSNLNESSRC
ncbi:hypothetical protein BU26DRAFT_265432 [Trematosphaeria pertusa]|uniref:Uncharacterized protein n=1 Tax=Trematosphaeria pertusa TaxID=390896 RepID=A0A6A6IM30_9PLEO|nr:uncharacterized protein BU26DRAFT_265432 [Trematosphaeria pertusa]KAF2250543.1 hypothetical protein BU26DRAFT_265432 [Trematosphaeria pertusa]